MNKKIFVIIILMGFVIFLEACNSSHTDYDDKIAQLNKEVEELEKSIKNLLTSNSYYKTQTEKLTAEVDNYKKIIAEYENEAKKNNNEILSNEDNIVPTNEITGTEEKVVTIDDFEIKHYIEYSRGGISDYIIVTNNSDQVSNLYFDGIAYGYNDEILALGSYIHQISYIEPGVTMFGCVYYDGASYYDHIDYNYTVEKSSLKPIVKNLSYKVTDNLYNLIFSITNYNDYATYSGQIFIVYFDKAGNYLDYDRRYFGGSINPGETKHVQFDKISYYDYYEVYLSGYAL